MQARHAYARGLLWSLLLVLAGCERQDQTTAPIPHPPRRFTDLCVASPSHLVVIRSYPNAILLSERGGELRDVGVKPQIAFSTVGRAGPGLLIAVEHSGAIWHSADDGRTWTASESPLPERSRPPARVSRPRLAIRQVRWHPDGFGLAVGEAGYVGLTLDRGVSWREVSPQSTALSFFDGAMVGGSTGVIVGAGGLVLRTEDQGANWEQVDSGVRTDLYAVEFANPKRGWCAGRNGTLLTTADGGSTWSPLEPFTDSSLLCLDAVDESTLLVAGRDGVCAVTVDAGRSFEMVEVPTTAWHVVHASSTGSLYLAGAGPQLWRGRWK